MSSLKSAVEVPCARLEHVLVLAPRPPGQTERRGPGHRHHQCVGLGSQRLRASPPSSASPGGSTGSTRRRGSRSRGPSRSPSPCSPSSSWSTRSPRSTPCGTRSTRASVRAAGAVLLSGADADLGTFALAAAGGLLALSSHSAKASVRVLVNTSPEPVSNVVVSTGEDGLVALLMTLAIANPELAARPHGRAVRGLDRRDVRGLQDGARGVAAHLQPEAPTDLSARGWGPPGSAPGVRRRRRSGPSAPSTRSSPGRSRLARGRRSSTT